MSAMIIEEETRIGFNGYWKIRFTMEEWNNSSLHSGFFKKWTKSPLYRFPFKITSSKGNLRISFSDKSCKFKAQPQEIYEHKDWFYQLYEEITGDKIEE